MKNTEANKVNVISLIREKQSELAIRFTVRRIGVFGSHARGNAGPDSDVDALVDLKEPTFDNYMDLKFYLEEILDHPVDLVIHDAIKP